GLGDIENSGLAIRPEFRQYDAASKFEITKKKIGSKTACSCGDIIRGKKEPVDCSLFAKQCTPENPVGPCMVSSEGACAAFYKYSNF
ncbi:MAG: hydrogenase formation protein HypD, partial [Ruminococcaceae bacterium]|nr:hydrogenase formation protein HypD [Oscillospiraceae bacterium]